jgi:hypothetical protein
LHYFIEIFIQSILSSSAYAATTYPCFDVKDHGAAGSSSTEDAEAINSAINTAGAATMMENGVTIN